MKKWMAKAACAGLLLTCLFILSSCVDFDGQEIHIRYDHHQDRLDALIIYRGLCASDDDTQKALEQLAEVYAKHRFFILDNWLGEFDIDALATSERKFERALSQQVTIRSSPIWLDGEGRPCGYQLVRITKVSMLLDEANTEFAKYLLTEEGLKNFVPDEMDPDSLKLLRDAATRRYRFFAFHGSAFTFSFPVSDVGARLFRLRLLQAARETIGQDKESKGADQLAEVLARNDLGVERVGNLLTFTLGNRDCPKILVEIPSKGVYKENLVKAMESQQWKFDKEGSIAAARRAFVDFCAEK